MFDSNTPRTSLDDDRWLTLNEVAEELQMHPGTMRLWANNGRLPAVRAGGRWRVRRSDLNRMLNSDSNASPAHSGEHPSASEASEPGDDGYRRRRASDHLIQPGRE